MSKNYIDQTLFLKIHPYVERQSGLRQEPRIGTTNHNEHEPKDTTQCCDPIFGLRIPAWPNVFLARTSRARAPVAQALGSAGVQASGQRSALVVSFTNNDVTEPSNPSGQSCRDFSLN